MKKLMIIAFAVFVVGGYALVVDWTPASNGSVKENFGENWSR